MEIKFLHFADAHIGVENHGRLDPSTGLHTRLQDFVNCLRFAFEEAIAEEVDLVVFAGDAYRSCDPTPTQQREFAGLIKMFSEARIPVVLVAGNHDTPVAFGKASSLDIFSTLNIPNFYVATKKDELFTIQTRSGSVQVACLPWLQRGRLAAKAEYQDLTPEQLVERLQHLGEEIIEGFVRRLDARFPAILVAHLAAADAAFSGSEQTAIIGRDPVFLTGTLANPAFDYVALGHIHKFQDLNPNGRPSVVYPGSIERIDFGEQEEPKGVCLVTIHNSDASSEAVPSREVEYRFLQTPARRFKTILVNVGDGADPTTAITNEILRHSLDDAVVRIFYEIQGSREVVIDVKAVKQALKNAFLLSSISPLPKPSVRNPRASISEHTGLKDALHAYLSNHPELACLEDDLQAGAAKLEFELEGGAS